MNNDMGGTAVPSNACMWRVPMPPAPTVHRRLRQAAGVEADQSEPFPELGDALRQEAELCVARLGDDAFHVRQVAAARLAAIGPGAVPLLLPIIERGIWSHALEGALDVLKRIADPRLVPHLCPLLGSPSGDVRLGALRSLRWLCDEPDAFVPCLTDVSWRIRREAVFALIELRREDFGDLFESMLRDEHAKVRAAAANGLGILGLGCFAHALIEMLDDPADAVRKMAAWSLARLDGRAVCECVLTLACMPASDRDVVLAARALAACPGQTAASAVIDAAMHGGCRAQVETVQAVARLGNADHLPFLEAMLRTGADRVRQAAAWAIGVHTLRCATRRGSS